MQENKVLIKHKYLKYINIIKFRALGLKWI